MRERAVLRIAYVEESPGSPLREFGPGIGAIRISREMALSMPPEELRRVMRLALEGEYRADRLERETR